MSTTSTGDIVAEARAEHWREVRALIRQFRLGKREIARASKLATIAHWRRTGKYPATWSCRAMLDLIDALTEIGQQKMLAAIGDNAVRH